MLGLMGLAAAFGLGLAAIFVAEKLDTTFHSADEVRAFVDLPVVATIRRIPTRAVARRRRWRAVLVVSAAVLLIGLVAVAAFYVATDNERLTLLTARGGM